jgi:hypothetical protein
MSAITEICALLVSSHCLLPAITVYLFSRHSLGEIHNCFIVTNLIPCKCTRDTGSIGCLTRIISPTILQLGFGSDLLHSTTITDLIKFSYFSITRSPSRGGAMTGETLRSYGVKNCTFVRIVVDCVINCLLYAYSRQHCRQPLVIRHVECCSYKCITCPKPERLSWDVVINALAEYARLLKIFANCNRFQM